MSAEFEKLKNKIEVAKAVIKHQGTVIAELKTALAAVPAPSLVTDVDYAELAKGLDDAFDASEVLTPAAPATTTPTAEPTILPQADPAHPNLQG
jgi:hypothetical protein